MGAKQSNSNVILIKNNAIETQEAEFAKHHFEVKRNQLGRSNPTSPRNDLTEPAVEYNR